MLLYAATKGEVSHAWFQEGDTRLPTSTLMGSFDHVDVAAIVPGPGVTPFFGFSYPSSGALGACQERSQKPGAQLETENVHLASSCKVKPVSPRWKPLCLWQRANTKEEASQLFDRITESCTLLSEGLPARHSKTKHACIAAESYDGPTSI